MKKYYLTMTLIIFILFTIILYFTPAGPMMIVDRIECKTGCTIQYNIFGMKLNECPPCFPEIGESYTLDAISLKCESYPPCVNRTLLGQVQIKSTNMKTGISETKTTASKEAEENIIGVASDFNFVVGDSYEFTATYGNISNSTICTSYPTSWKTFVSTLVVIVTNNTISICCDECS